MEKNKKTAFDRIFSGFIVLLGDMLLGWGTAVSGTTGLEANYSKYIGVSDIRIFWSALLGTIGIPLECMSWFGIYRLMAERSPRHAHAYRAGILGCMLFGVSVLFEYVRRTVFGENDRVL